jgi:hypothetical protein
MDNLLYKYKAYHIRRNILNNDVDALLSLMTNKKEIMYNMVIQTCIKSNVSLNIEQSWRKLLTSIINDSEESFEKVISAAKIMVSLCSHGWELIIVNLIRHLIEHLNSLTRHQILEIISLLKIVRKKGSDHMLKEISDYLYTNLSLHSMVGRMLGAIENDSSILIGYFKETKDYLIRMHILIALAEVADETAIDFLIQNIGSNHEHIYKTAIECLGETGSPKAIPVLQKLLLEKFTDVVVQAIVLHGEDAIHLTASALLAKENAWRIAERLIGLGIPRSERLLIKILSLSSDTMVAKYFLNSRNQQLYHAAHNWASDHGYLIKKEYGKKTPYWGDIK